MTEVTVNVTPGPDRRGRPRKTIRERDGSLRRTELVHIAAYLFRTKGFSTTSTREIASVAGIQSGSLFYWFKSKEALLAAVVRDGMVKARRRQDAALKDLGSCTSARVRLAVLIRQHFDSLFGNDSDFVLVMLHEWRCLTPSQRRSVLQQRNAYEAEWVPVLADLHRSGQLKAQPDVARLFIFGALNWTVQWVDLKGALSLDELADQAMRLFVEGI